MAWLGSQHTRDDYKPHLLLGLTHPQDGAGEKQNGILVISFCTHAGRGSRWGWLGRTSLGENTRTREQARVHRRRVCAFSFMNSLKG